MIHGKFLVAAAAVSLALTPMAAHAAASEAPPPAAEQVTGDAQFLPGTSVHWLVLGAIVLAVLVLVVLDDDEEPVSP